MFGTNVWMRVTCSTSPVFYIFLPAFFGCDSCEKKPTVPEGTGTPRLVTIRTGNPENTASIQPKSQQCVAGTYQYPSTRQRAHALVAPGYFRYLYWTSKLHCRLLTTSLKALSFVAIPPVGVPRRKTPRGRLRTTRLSHRGNARHSTTNYTDRHSPPRPPPLSIIQYYFVHIHK